MYVTVTIPEGFTVEQIAERLAGETGIPADEFKRSPRRRRSRSRRSTHSSRFNATTLPRGLPVPEDVPGQEGRDGRRRHRHDARRSSSKETADARPLRTRESKGLDLHDVVTIASMIERETRLAEERPLVASVIYNRLDARHAARDRRDHPVRARQQAAAALPRPASATARTTPTCTRVCRRVRSRARARRRSRRRRRRPRPGYIYYVLTGKDGSHTLRHERGGVPERRRSRREEGCGESSEGTSGDRDRRARARCTGRAPADRRDRRRRRLARGRRRARSTACSARTARARRRRSRCCSASCGPTARRRSTCSGADSTTPQGRRALGFLPEQPYFPRAADRARRRCALYGRLVGSRPRRTARRDDSACSSASGSRAAEHDAALEVLARHAAAARASRRRCSASPRSSSSTSRPRASTRSGSATCATSCSRCATRGVTVLLSSHQLSEVEAVCDRVTHPEPRGAWPPRGRSTTCSNVAGHTSVPRARPRRAAARRRSPRSSRTWRRPAASWVFSVADDDVRARRRRDRRRGRARRVGEPEARVARGLLHADARRRSGAREVALMHAAASPPSPAPSSPTPCGARSSTSCSCSPRSWRSLIPSAAQLRRRASIAAIYREVALALMFVAALVLTLVARGEPRSRPRSSGAPSTTCSPSASAAGSTSSGTWLGLIVGRRRGDRGVHAWSTQVRRPRRATATRCGGCGRARSAIWLEMGVLAGVRGRRLGGDRPGRRGHGVARVPLRRAHPRRPSSADESLGSSRALYPSLDTFNVINPVAHGAGIGCAYALR